MKRKKIRTVPALLALLVTAALILVLGQLRVRQAAASFREEDAAMPGHATERLLAQLRGGDYHSLYEATMAIRPSMDAESAYTEMAGSIIEKWGSDALNVQCAEEACGLYAGDEYLAEIVLQETGNGWQAGLPLAGDRTAVVEVPAGEPLVIHGETVSRSLIIEENVPAANGFQFADESKVPRVDVYQLEGLLSEPAADDLVLVQDPITGHYLAGRPVTDEELKKEMIRDGELIAGYPAQDNSLAEVAAIALTSSSWYQRYTTLQNYWFTAHRTHEFSNEQVLRAAYQNDDTIVAHVVFDYFADNGEVHRTWHIGYQMTFLNTADGWKVAGMEINNELNPNTVIPQ